VAALQELKRLGVRIAVDDFGTGYSSLGYLQQFPVDILKIDRSFVSGLSGGPDDPGLTQAIVKLGKSLGLETIAEGIEQLEQLDALRQLGCHLGQGFYFSRPLPLERIEPLLEQINSAAAEAPDLLKSTCEQLAAGVPHIDLRPGVSDEASA
jgi:EAL domain-containing protein (putative c-di-GMP-specific phosphodiesterase class I)